ncbi:RDD family protein [Paucibacter sp. B2R-40]|uniref:RDD family protein n=1 Tax=Paucibacter sp. B2R-40 TaxID=2893554 RepID=UPI0021E43D6F|nr:RDD family protein [Paucibacter sp. B2R-40]MCV2355053.1 RDD family protein [Paucibacter sp. B2R-40]
MTDASLERPSLKRRMAAFVYEGVVLFGVVFATAFLFGTLTQQRHAMQGQHALQAVLFVVLGVYFCWFWTRGGQTVAMKAWHIRLVDLQGRPLSRLRALMRYCLSWLWFAPALLSVWMIGVRSTGAIFSTLLAGVAAYALLSRLHPSGQFLHDVICGTQLITQKPLKR